MCEFRKGEETEFRNRVSHDGRLRGVEGVGGEFHHCEEERSPYISIFYTVNLTSFRLTGVLKMKFIRDFTNFARTLQLGRKSINCYFLCCNPIRV